MLHLALVGVACWWQEEAHSVQDTRLSCKKVQRAALLLILWPLQVCGIKLAGHADAGVLTLLAFGACLVWAPPVPHRLLAQAGVGTSSTPETGTLWWSCPALAYVSCLQQCCMHAGLTVPWGKPAASSGPSHFWKQQQQSSSQITCNSDRYMLIFCGAAPHWLRAGLVAVVCHVAAADAAAVSLPAWCSCLRC